MSRKPELQDLKAVAKPKFEPNKAYTWAADAKFVLTGKEIEILSRALTIQTSNEASYQKFLWLQEAMITMNKVLEESYTEGIIQERPMQMKAVPTTETAVPKEDAVVAEPVVESESII